MTRTVLGAGDIAVTRPSAASAGAYILVGKMDISKFSNALTRSFHISQAPALMMRERFLEKRALKPRPE